MITQPSRCKTNTQQQKTLTCIFSLNSANDLSYRYSHYTRFRSVITVEPEKGPSNSPSAIALASGGAQSEHRSLTPQRARSTAGEPRSPINQGGPRGACATGAGAAGSISCRSAQPSGLDCTLSLHVLIN